MRGNLLIRGARAVLRDRVLPNASVRVERGVIAAVQAAPLDPRPGDAVIDAGGRWLLPGFVDVHCDAIEREVQPRPGTRLPYALGLAELDRKLALAGITTMFHSISFGAGEGVRNNEVAAEVVREVAKLGTGPTLVRHHVHLRYEVSNWAALELATALVEEGCVSLLSLMDHTPGQGQYRDPERFRLYVRKTYWATESEIDRIVREKLEGRARVTKADLQRLAKAARAAGVALAAHDLDSVVAVDEAAELGATIVEFPVSYEAAKRATDRGLHVCVGAPNVLRGGSHDGNLSARALIGSRAADLLCSDYYPSGLLPAVFGLAETGVCSLPGATALASANPARALGLGGAAGSITPGLAADLLLVDSSAAPPALAATIVGGEVVLTTAPRPSRAQPRDPLPLHL